MPDSVLNENQEDDDDYSDEFSDESELETETERTSGNLYAAAAPIAAVFALFEGNDTDRDETGEETSFVRADAAFNVEEVIRGLTERWLLPADRVDAFRRSVQALQANNDSHAQSALTTLTSLAQEGSTVNQAQARNLVELAILIGQHNDLLVNISGFTEPARATALRETVELAGRLARLEELSRNRGADRVAIERVRTAVNAQLAQPGNDAGRLAELNRVVERLTSPEFLRQPNASGRLAAFADLLSLTNRNLRIPYETLLDPRISVENLRFAVDRFKESAIKFGPPADRNPRLGTTREYNSSRMAMDAYHGGPEIFIPAANGSVADRGGIDGMRFNPVTGEIHFVDWTNDMARKYAEGKAEFAMSPDARLIHDYTDTRSTAPGQRELEAFRAEFEAGLRGEGCGRRSGHTVPQTNRTRLAGLPIPSFAVVPADAGADAVRRFVEAVGLNAERVNTPGEGRGWRYADPVIEHMEQRARNSYGNLLAGAHLATRLARPIAQLAELQVRSRQPGDVSFDASAIRPQIDRSNVNEVTGRPMRYIELPINMEVNARRLPGERFLRGGTLVSMRLYEDGTIRGTLETSGENSRRQTVEIGHVRDMVPLMRQKVTQDIKDKVVEREAAAMLDRLTSVNANSPIDFARESALVEAFGIAGTQPERVMAAHTRSRNIDDVKDKLRKFDIEISDSDAARLAERFEGATRPDGAAVRRAYDGMRLELALNIDQARAAQIVTMAEEMQSRLSLPREVALDAAALRTQRSLPETSAVATAREMVEVRRLNPGAGFDAAATVARAQLEQLRLTAGAAGEFRQTLRDAIREARPGHELADIWTRLMEVSETRALGDGAHAGAWSNFHDSLAAMTDGQFREFIGVPTTGDVTSSLDLVSRRAAERDRPAATGGSAPGPEVVRPADLPSVPAPTTPIEPGRRVTIEGTAYDVAGQSGSHTLLHQPGAPGEIAGEPITNTDFTARYEEVRVRVNGAEEVRYIERGHPERGLYRAQTAAGTTVIGLDPTMRVIETARVTTTPVAPPAPPVTTAGAGTPPPAKPPAPAVERPRPELPAPPSAESLVRTEHLIGPDGTIRATDQRVGESMRIEALRDQTELTNDQIRFLEEQAERLKQSTNAEERARGAELADTARALKGEFGVEARTRAHRAILESSRAELNRRRPGGGGGGAGVGVAVGLGILLTAALGWYLSEQRIPTSPLRRATVGT